MPLLSVMIVIFLLASNPQFLQGPHPAITSVPGLSYEPVPWGLSSLVLNKKE